MSAIPQISTQDGVEQRPGNIDQLVDNHQQPALEIKPLDYGYSLNMNYFNIFSDFIYTLSGTNTFSGN